MVLRLIIKFYELLNAKLEHVAFLLPRYTSDVGFSMNFRRFWTACFQNLSDRESSRRFESLEYWPTIVKSYNQIHRISREWLSSQLCRTVLNRPSFSFCLASVLCLLITNRTLEPCDSVVLPWLTNRGVVLCGINVFETLDFEKTVPNRLYSSFYLW